MKQSSWIHGKTYFNRSLILVSYESELLWNQANFCHSEYDFPKKNRVAPNDSNENLLPSKYIKNTLLTSIEITCVMLSLRLKKLSSSCLSRK
jgi:hypothetical protein